MDNNFSCKQKNGVGQIRKITWLGLVSNLFLFGIKTLFGILGNSQALVADAVHTLTDVSTDLAVLLGVKFWTKPPDQEHPYGHNRIEIIISIGIGIILFATAVGIGYNALISIRKEHLSSPSWIAFWAALAAIIIKEIIYRKTLAIGKRNKSSAVIANAWHHRSDALSSIPVAIAVAAAAINKSWAFLDHLGAFIVCLFIIQASWKIISKAFQDMIDTGVSKQYINKIKDLVISTEGVKDAHAIRSRNIASKIFVDLHVLVDSNLSVKKSHSIAESVKKALINSQEDIIDVVVHIEPYQDGESYDSLQSFV
ncbi:MAG: cation diffusion facilitator family transporter [Candidatus Omnitrophica bacterium]|nr:cation diffusion facilitator family transporter [Candidatus Omnitrophota bacterium]